MYFILGLLFCTTCFAATKIEIVPRNEAELKKHFMSDERQRDPMENGWDRAWSYLHDRIVENRGEMFFTALTSVPKKHSKIKRTLPWTKLKKETNWIISWNMPTFVHSDKYRALPKEKLALFLIEPSTSRDGQYDEEITKRFSKIFTWRDDLVDGKQFIKFYPPVLRPATEPIPFKERQFACMIEPSFCDEVSALIDYFKEATSFDLYGSDREEANNPIETARHYRFSFCLEDRMDCPGYITEKIFNAFASLSIPIYQGAPNISDEIPAECFIDLRNFASFDELHTYLKEMSEEKFQSYLTHIQAYLKSPQAQRFSTENFTALLEQEFLGN